MTQILPLSTTSQRHLPAPIRRLIKELRALHPSAYPEEVQRTYEMSRLTTICREDYRWRVQSWSQSLLFLSVPRSFTDRQAHIGVASSHVLILDAELDVLHRTELHERLRGGLYWKKHICLGPHVPSFGYELFLERPILKSSRLLKLGCTPPRSTYPVLQCCCSGDAASIIRSVRDPSCPGELYRMHAACNMHQMIAMCRLPRLRSDRPHGVKDAKVGNGVYCNIESYPKGYRWILHINVTDPFYYGMHEMPKRGSMPAWRLRAILLLTNIRYQCCSYTVTCPQIGASI